MEDDENRAAKERLIFLALGVIAFVVAVVLIILALSAFHATSVPATSKGQPAGHEMCRSSSP